MPARNVRYVRNARFRPDDEGRMAAGDFGQFMLSEQIQDVAEEGARDIAALATADQKISSDPYTAEAHEPIVIAGNPRATAQVVGNDRLHAVEEFGSGTRSQGTTAGQPRPQGGYSEPRRTLAKAAAQVVPPAEVKPA